MTSAATALRLVLSNGWLAPADIVAEVVSTDTTCDGMEDTALSLQSALSAAQPAERLAARQLVAAVTAGTVSAELSNVEINRNLWNTYAAEWGAEKVVSFCCTLLQGVAQAAQLTMRVCAAMAAKDGQ
jgi:hypothetical protein